MKRDPRQTTKTISAAVEGVLDEAVLRQVVRFAGGEIGTVYGKVGKEHLRTKIKGYNNAARFSPWCVLVDLDQEADCAPTLISTWLSEESRFMSFRVAVRSIEAWLLADSDSLARFLSVSRTKFPGVSIDSISDPKRLIVDLADQSSRKDIRIDMVPRVGSGRSIGPAYTSRLVEYVSTRWRPDKASLKSESLRRCVEALKLL